MRPKNLIKENQLIKIAKVSPFQIRSKPKSLKISQGERQSKNNDFPSPSNRQLQLCIDCIHRELKNEITTNKALLQRIARLLHELKTRWQPIDEHQVWAEPQQHQILSPPCIVRKSSSKYLSKNRFQALEQPRLSEGLFIAEKCGIQNKKSKLVKVKIGKQNHERFFPPQELKLEKQTSKLEQTQILVRSQKEQIQKLKLQIENALEANEQLKKQKEEYEQQSKVMKGKLQSLAEQKQSCQSSYQEKIKTTRQKEEQARSLNSVLRGQLKQRQRQIAAIWQLRLY